MTQFRTLSQAIEDAAKCDPTRGFRFVPDEGLGAGGKEATFSFTAIERASARYGGALQALGLRKGDRVALILPASEDFILCFFGAVRAGIIPVPIYPPMGLGQLQTYLDNTRHIIAKSGARAVVTPSKIKRLLGTVQAACPALEQVIAVESIRESLEPLKAPTIGLDDAAFLQFTSGSTSRPKGVTVTHGNLAANIHCIMALGLKVDETTECGVSWLPLYHDMGLIGFVLGPIMQRINCVFLPPLLFLKRPIEWLRAISKHKGTVAFAPNFAYALSVKRIHDADLEGIDLSSWRVAGCGAEPIRPEALEAFAAAFAKVGFRKEALLPSYGMAESALAIAFSDLGQGMKTLTVHGPTLWAEGVARTVVDDDDTGGGESVRLVSCGREFAEHKIRIFDPDDASSASPLSDHKVGEIRIAGSSVMTGYWEDLERTRDAFAGPFLRTGDLGFLHAGELFICGRSKEVVIVHGRNYYPQDMEWEAAKVAGVRKGNVIAFGARDAAGAEPDRERVVIALETQTPEAGVDEPARAHHEQALCQAVRKAVQEGLGLTLDDVVVLGPGVLPKTSSGKLQRAKTRELYEAGELSQRSGNQTASAFDVARHAVSSQLSYFKLAVLGGRKKG